MKKKKKVVGLDPRLDQAGIREEVPIRDRPFRENWTRLPFKDDMLIHVKKAFSQEDRAGGKAPVLHSYGLICTYIQDITPKY